MEEINFLDFDIHIDRTTAGYRVRVMNSPAGQADAEFKTPFSDLEVENFILRVGRTRKGVRRLESPEMEAARKFGGGLFEAVFPSEVRGRLRSSFNAAKQQGSGLRVRLHLMDVPELAELPWEYLYDATLDEFLVLSVQTPLVRYLDLPLETSPLEIGLPLKVLVMISSPTDYPELDVEKEYENLVLALSELEKSGMVQLTRLDKASLAELQRQLRREDYHIFHFIGHGGFDQQAQDGVLLLEEENGKGRPVSGRYLGTVLHDQKTLRLAILNACEGARAARSDPFSGVAHSLVQKGIPAVIAMQFEITDEAAIVLAREFYGAIADGYPVDASLAEARKAVFAQNNDIEWGTPVMYMRSPDGRIFGLNRSVRQELQARKIESAGEAALAAAADPNLAQPGPAEIRSIPAPAGQVSPQAGGSAALNSGLPVSGAAQAAGVPAAEPHTHPHRRPVLPWLIALVATLGLVLAALSLFGVINPARLLGAGSSQPPGIAAQLPLGTESVSGAGALLPPTETQTATTSPTPSLEAETQEPVVAVPVLETVTPTQQASPSETSLPTATETPGPTPIGGGPGQLAFASDRAETGIPQIWLMGIDGSNPVQLTNRQGGACQPAWSPDGMQLVFVSPCKKNEDRYINSALYLINVDGSAESQLTDGIGGDYDPAWAPNQLIAFTSERSNIPNIYTIDPAVGGEPVALTKNSPNYQPNWSLDGQQIVFVSNRSGTPKIFTMPSQGEIAVDGHRAMEFSRGSEFAYVNPQYSPPDGNYLMFLKSVLPPDKTKLPVLTGSKIEDKGLKEFTIGTQERVGTIKEARFSPDGDWILFESWPGFIHDIWIMSASGSDKQQITQDAALDFDAAWRP
jgi:Tol biopolymer transport system component